MGFFNFLFRKARIKQIHDPVSAYTNYCHMPQKEAPNLNHDEFDFIPKGSSGYLNIMLSDGRTIRQAQMDSYHESEAAEKRVCRSNSIQENYDFIIGHIRYSVSPPSKVYEIIEPERQFIIALINSLLQENINNRINLVRMADGTLSVHFKSYPIGKIKLTGRKTYMQVLRTNDHSVYDNLDLNAYIGHIKKWISYIRRLKI